ncbi:uncharacterized protein HaLaN_11655 [Haematococcus lacustris]|uniref:Protein root UVB sensitive/RUS domain-containing protein n=1 Tax=Haematococcus lacustris TaxID=44745 RepID=A0A699Z8I7_HAELA|nr:uncharacterized protein HaLaN_11655 [Haematococcus lacustris]
MSMRCQTTSSPGHDPPPLVWLQDGAGRLGRLLFARWGRELDCELKQFRLAGDLLMEGGAALELATIVAPRVGIPAPGLHGKPGQEPGSCGCLLHPSTHLPHLCLAKQPGRHHSQGGERGQPGRHPGHSGRHYALAHARLAPAAHLLCAVCWLLGGLKAGGGRRGATLPEQSQAGLQRGSLSDPGPGTQCGGG